MDSSAKSAGALRHLLWPRPFPTLVCQHRIDVYASFFNADETICPPHPSIEAEPRCGNKQAKFSFFVCRLCLNSHCQHIHLGGI
jgi:hypothetical protein